MRVVPGTGEDALRAAPPEAADALDPHADEDGFRAYPLVLVDWQDAHFDFDQASPEDSPADYLVHTVGFLVSEGTRFVSIAQEVLPDGDGFRAVTHIPRSAIERLVPLHAGPRDVGATEAS